MTRWVALGDITQGVRYGYTASAVSAGSHRLLRTTDIVRRPLVWDEVPYCSPSPKDAKRYLLADNDIVIEVVPVLVELEVAVPRLMPASR